MMNLQQALQKAFGLGIEIGSQQVEKELPRGTALAADIYDSFGPEPLHMILDVGANVGQSARRFSADFPHAVIHCFEPVPAAYQDLARNTADLAQVHTHPIAMSAEEGWTDIYIGTESSLSSAAVRSPGDVAVAFKASTVDAFCEANGIEAIDLLKIDTEGYDLHVLAGAARTLAAGLVRFVLVEAALADGDPRFIGIGSFVAQLAPHRYEVFGLYDQMPHLAGRKSLAYFNLLFAHADEIERGPWI